VTDQFEIYNLVHIWEDPQSPCQTPYLGNYKATSYAIADIEIRGVGKHYAEGLVTFEADVIEKGAMVLIKQLAEGPVQGCE
jgi:hypothetical protein